MKPLRQRLEDHVRNHQTPSVQYLFFDTDNILFEYRHGLANVKEKQEITASTRYHLFSVTKTFTALAVLQLVQAGKIRLDHPVIEYLPGFPYPQAITVEQLLSHTSGIPNPLPLRWVHRREEHAGFDHGSFFADIFRQHPKLDFEPGTKFRYSNLGYVALGQLIEQVSGETFEDYVAHHITGTIGVNGKDLNFTLDDSTDAVGYQKWLSVNNALFTFLIDKPKFMGPREGAWKPFRPFYNNGAAYGGLMGNGQALVKYAQALLKPDSPLLDDSFRSILFEEAHVNGKPTGMAHSWFTGALNGQRYFAHAGGGGGYYIELRIYPELRIGSVILFNRTGVRDERILDKFDCAFIS